MSEIRLKMTMRIVGSTHDFGSGPGILMTAEAVFPGATEADLSRPFFQMAALETAERFVSRNIKVDLERIVQ